jgi:hypothetical protein
VRLLLSKLAQVTEKGAIQIRKLIGLYCIASSVFVFGLAVVIQGAFAGAMASILSRRDNPVHRTDLIVRGRT